MADVNMPATFVAAPSGGPTSDMGGRENKGHPKRLSHIHSPTCEAGAL